MTALRCLRCDVELQEGYLPDLGHGHHYFLTWIAGPPTKTIFGTAKVTGKNPVQIQAYRCPQCGRLELYVPNQPEEGAQH